MAKILLVEDEFDIYEPVRAHLAHEHHQIEVVTNGREALNRLRFYNYDLIILDLILPGLDGMEVCRKFRKEGGTTPVLMLTARSTTSERVTGLDAGADDYLVKPFEFSELSARARALLRRPSVFSGNVLSSGLITLDLTAHRVTLAGNELQLLPKEFAILEFFMRHPNQVFSQEAIMDRVWKSESDASPETVRTYIRRLRQKITVSGSRCPIQTVHGIGYIYNMH